MKIKRLIGLLLVLLYILLITGCTGKKEQQIEEKRNNCTRVYFENLDKESSLEQIVEDLGPYGISGSGILYHVWHLNDGTRAEVVFDSKGNIVRIYIIGDENSELIYEREY